MFASAAVPTASRVAALTLTGLLLLPAMVPAQEPRAEAGSPFAPALEAVAGTRRQAGCAPGPTDEAGRAVTFRGRPAVEVTGRERGAGTVVDSAVFDPAARRIVAYTCFANASTRQAGEPILSMSEISSRADKLAASIFPRSNLALESVRRQRESGQEQVYFEARYVPPPADFPFFEPPVRLLLDASTGGLFRLDVDPDWLDPAAPPRTLITRKAAERIAALAVRSRDLAPAFGRGAELGKVAASDLFTLRPNGWLGFYPDDPDARARVAWVVLLWFSGGDAPGPHSLFVDAATGRVLGGQAGGPAGAAPR